jgi:hypothetical protein
MKKPPATTPTTPARAPAAALNPNGASSLPAPPDCDAEALAPPEAREATDEAAELAEPAADAALEEAAATALEVALDAALDAALEAAPEAALEAEPEAVRLATSEGLIDTDPVPLATGTVTEPEVTDWEPHSADWSAVACCCSAVVQLLWVSMGSQRNSAGMIARRRRSSDSPTESALAGGIRREDRSNGPMTYATRHAPAAFWKSALVHTQDASELGRISSGIGDHHVAQYVLTTRHIRRRRQPGSSSSAHTQGCWKVSGALGV